MPCMSIIRAGVLRGKQHGGALRFTKTKKMLRTYTTISLLCCISAPLYAGNAVKFSSAYTDLSKDCKWLFEESQLQEGQDNALTCPGYGGFSLQIDASGTYSTLHVTNTNSEFRLPRTPILRNNRKGMVEWRMANAKPFAIIVRSLTLDKSGEVGSERLAVLGLQDFESIDGYVETTGNSLANEQARNLADIAYAKSRRKF
jgi:hypothetical protein